VLVLSIQIHVGLDQIDPTQEIQIPVQSFFDVPPHSDDNNETRCPQGDSQYHTQVAPALHYYLVDADAQDVKKYRLSGHDPSPQHLKIETN
jgi:hypothetical protein